MRRCLLVAALFAFPAAQAAAGPLEQARAEGAVECGGMFGPGLAWPDGQGGWHGLLADLCRAVAVAALGDGARFRFHPYTRPRDGARLRAGQDQLAFLTASDLLEDGLLDVALPGPVAFIRTYGLMVPSASTTGAAAQLGEGEVCVEPGTIAERALRGFFAARGLALHEFPFQEQEEMQDAFAAGRCAALAGDMPGLAARRSGGARLLPDVLAADPVLMVTRQEDGRWAAVVAWTLATLRQADRPGARPDAAGMLRTLPLPGAALGLAPGWQGQVLKAVGGYGAIWRRNLGADSSLGLGRGVNDLSEGGGVFAPPVAP